MNRQVSQCFTRKIEFIGLSQQSGSKGRRIFVLSRRGRDNFPTETWLPISTQRIHAVGDFPALWATNEKRDVMHQASFGIICYNTAWEEESLGLLVGDTLQERFGFELRALCWLKAKTVVMLTERGWTNSIRWLFVTNDTPRNQITICIKKKKMSQLHLGGFGVVKMGLTEGRKRISHPVTTGNLQTLRVRSPL